MGPADGLGMSRAVIRITPEWIASWGIEPGETGLKVRRSCDRSASAAGAVPSSSCRPDVGNTVLPPD